MCTPVLRALRNARPSARITAVVRPGLDEVLAGAPWLDQITVTPLKGLAGPYHVGRMLRRLDADVVLLLPNSFRSALAARLGSSQRRIGYARDRRAFLLTHAVPPPGRDFAQPLPTVEYYAHLGCVALGIDTIDFRLELATTDAEESAAQKLLEGVDGAFALLNPGANKPPKRWPADRFAHLADALNERLGLSVVVTGQHTEHALIDQLLASTRVPVINLADRGVTLGSLKAVVRRAAVLVTNDTGPRHLAAAMGTPTVTLYGPTDHRWTTLQDVKEHTLIAEPFLTQDRIADQHARSCSIDRISVGDAIFGVERIT
jgi:heptosyltransferase-2